MEIHSPPGRSLVKLAFTHDTKLTAPAMYIVAIAWIYVVLMVSITQPTPLKGVLTFLGTGLLPLALFLWLVGTPQRRRRQAQAEASEATTPPGASPDAGESGKPDQ